MIPVTNPTLIERTSTDTPKTRMGEKLGHIKQLREGTIERATVIDNLVTYQQGLLRSDSEPLLASLENRKATAASIFNGFFDEVSAISPNAFVADHITKGQLVLNEARNTQQELLQTIAGGEKQLRNQVKENEELELSLKKYGLKVKEDPALNLATQAVQQTGKFVSEYLSNSSVQ